VGQRERGASQQVAAQGFALPGKGFERSLFRGLSKFRYPQTSANPPGTAAGSCGMPCSLARFLYDNSEGALLITAHDSEQKTFSALSFTVNNNAYAVRTERVARLPVCRTTLNGCQSSNSFPW